VQDAVVAGLQVHGVPDLKVQGCDGVVVEHQGDKVADLLELA